jgi:hypothetical protein
MNRRAKRTLTGRALAGAGVLAVVAVAGQASAQTYSSDPLMNALIKKGILSQEEAQSIKAEAEAEQSNNVPAMALDWNKWKINSAIKSVELFGDIRVRYEYRMAAGPDSTRIELDRARYAVRLGLRGDAFDDVYYGLRLSMASNPRSPWVTFGTSTSGTPYQGPFGKSTAGVDIDQLYLGWRPEKWVDVTIGKMSNPLYTTSMVWDPDLNPEGAAERFKYSLGKADFFTTFGQFLYADENPTYGSTGLGFNTGLSQRTTPIFELAWQAGLNYQITTNMSAKIGATVYQYVGTTPSISPFFGDPFVGEGQYTGPASGIVDGSSGYGTSGPIIGNGSVGFPNNQVGLDHLLVVEVPFEFNFKISQLNARVFGDGAYNLDGSQRAEAAATGYANYLAYESGLGAVSVTPFPPQRNDVKAYQVGFALSNTKDIGLINGSVLRKNGWEVRTFWQHIEQYALDVNQIDSDFFEGRGNLQGIFAAAAYSFTDNMMVTLRYGHATRINKLLGTGGSNQDIPQVNPILDYDIFQADLTFKF